MVVVSLLKHCSIRLRFQACLLNYKGDGTPFWNQIFVAPLHDADGNIVNFVSVQCEVTKGPENAEPKRGRKRSFDLLMSLTGKGAGEPAGGAYY